MPRVYDKVADDAFRAESTINSAWEEGDFLEVNEYINTLYNAASEFYAVASLWEEVAEKWENKLVDEGRM